MMQFLMMLALSGIHTDVKLAQVQSCTWPNKCQVEALVAQVQSCTWPNKCAKPAGIVL